MSLASRQPDKNDDLYFDMSSVAFGNGSYVAVGWDAWCTYDPPRLCWPAAVAVWTSTDGQTWVRVPSDPVFRLGNTPRIGAPVVAAWESRFVAAGRYGDEGVAVWISEPSGA